LSNSVATIVELRKFATVKGEFYGLKGQPVTVMAGNGPPPVPESGFPN
jgi:hypothetical protein